MRDSEAGFTMIELLMVTVLLTLMASILYGSLTGIIRARNFIDREISAVRTSRYVLSRMTDELMGKVAENLQTDPANPRATEGGQETAGQPRVRRTYLRGINGKLDETDADSLRFVSATGAQEVFNASGNYGRVEIEYRLEEPNEGMRSGGSGAESPSYRTYILVREEVPAGVKDKKVAEKRRIVFPLAENVTGLNFRYLRNGKWEEEWTDVQAVFPEAIEIAVSIRAESGQVETFRTAVPLGRRAPQLAGFTGLGLGNPEPQVGGESSVAGPDSG